MSVSKNLFTQREWLIAAGRTLIATFGLFAVWIDPSQPVRFQEFTYGLLWVYLAHAVLLWLLSTFRSLPSEGMALFAHVIDLTTISLLMCFTDGPTSPFFVLFTFTLLVATLRWNWKGVLLTACASLAVLFALGWWLGHVVYDSAFELNQFIIRVVYLAVVGVLLAFLSAHQDRTRAVMSGLAMQTPQLLDDIDWPVEEAVKFVSEALAAPKIILAWADHEEPWQHIALWSNQKITFRSEPPDRFEPLVADPVREYGFISQDVGDNNSVVLHEGGGRFSRWRGHPLHQQLCEAYAIRSVMSVPIKVPGLDVRLFLIGPLSYGAEDLPLLELAGMRIRTLFEQFILLRRLKFAAADEERLRLARDIHDGVLQFLAGAGLSLRALTKLVTTDPDTAKRRIAEIQQSLVTEQVQLRALINSLRTRNPANPVSVPHLEDSLAPLIAHLRDQWSMDIKCHVEPVNGALDQDRIQDLARIISEAVANARRHGQATQARITVALDSYEIELRISDNGKGFPTAGRFEHQQLRLLGIGPRSLSERVERLRGFMVVTTGDAGTSLEIRLPLQLPVEKYQPEFTVGSS